jgi:hypothetical protein
MQVIDKESSAPWYSTWRWLFLDTSIIIIYDKQEYLFD